MILRSHATFFVLLVQRNIFFISFALQAIFRPFHPLLLEFFYIDTYRRSTHIFQLYILFLFFVISSYVCTEHLRNPIKKKGMNAHMFKCVYCYVFWMMCVLLYMYIWWRKKRCMDEIRDQQWRLLFNLFRFSFSDFLWASNVIFYVEMKLVLVDRLIFNDELIKLLKDSF